MSLPSSYLDLTPKQRIYVDSLLSGLTKTASAAAAGSNRYEPYEKSEKVREAIVAMTAMGAEEVGFGRREAHDMYMEAYQNAETAMEQIAAVNALVKLHGLEAPKKVEVEHNHTHSGELRFVPDDELMKLAGMDGQLTLEGEYEEVGEAPQLEPPKITEENSVDHAEVRETSGYD